MTEQTPPHDDALIREALQAILGKKTELAYFDPYPDAPFAKVLETGKRFLNTDFHVYWAKGGSPRIFALYEGFSKPVAVFSERVVEVWSDFRNIFTNTMLGPELKRDVAVRLMLRTMAEVSLTLADDPVVSVQLAMAASECSPGVLFQPNKLANLEYESRGLHYMSCWFFAFAHEIGHFQSHSLNEDWRDYAIDQLISNIRSLEAVDQIYRNELITEIQSGRAGPLYDVDQLMVEAMADANAMIILLESSIAVMDDAGLGNEFSMSWFYSEAIMALNFVATFAQIEHMFQAWRNGPADRRTGLELSLYKSVIGARANLAFSIFREFLHVSNPENSRYQTEAQFDLLVSVSEGLQNDIVTWDKASGEVIKTIFELPMPVNMHEFFININRTSIDTSELQLFLDVAEAADKKSWCFEALAHKVANPDKKIRLDDFYADVQGMHFFILTLKLPSEESLPLCVAIDQTLVCFVFHTSELFEDYRSLIDHLTEGKVSIETAALAVRSEEDVSDRLKRWLLPHGSASILIQGSDEFHEQYLRLFDRIGSEGIGIFSPL